MLDLLAAGVIKESKSPFESLVVLVKKKDDSLRVCVDFRKLNARTMRYSYPLPYPLSVFTLDLQSGYLQVRIEDKYQCKTAMTTPFGLCEYTRMPFGLTNDLQEANGALSSRLELLQVCCLPR